MDAILKPAFLFDLDGTLVDSVYQHVLPWRQALTAEGIDVFVYTSADGTVWEAKAVAGMEQKFYVGEYPLLVNLSARPEAKFVRVHWDVYHWGRGGTGARFKIALRLREVSQEDLREAASTGAVS